MLPGPGIFRELAQSRRTRVHGTRGLVDAIPSTGGLRVITAGIPFSGEFPPAFDAVFAIYIHKSRHIYD